MMHTAIIRTIALILFVLTNLLSTDQSTVVHATSPALQVAPSTVRLPARTDALQEIESNPPAASHLLPTQTNQNPIRLWHDMNDDLWIATPFYIWNITGGKRITLFGNVESEWFPSSNRADDRVVDVLFLAPGSDTQVKNRILFSLPDEASVYLERQTSKGVEGLELTFRQEDGLIGLTHRWQGEDMPTDSLNLRPMLMTAHGAVTQEVTGTLSTAEAALPPEEYHYYARFDPATDQGYALLQRKELSSVSQSSQLPCPEQTSISRPTAYDHCQFPDYFLPGQVVGHAYLFFYQANPIASLQPVQNLVARFQLALPDLNAASITRTPRYDYLSPKNLPDAGDPVTFVARVANRGSQATGSFAYTWYVDDVPILNNTSSSLAPGAMTTLSLNWTWQTGAHTVRIQLDPQNALSEVSEQNNLVEIRTDSLAVGFWVEQSVYDWFNVHQIEVGLGSVSWDDWAQRQLRIWNQMFTDGISPLTPQGITDRVRLDQVVIIPDGTWGDCVNWPNPEDRTVDLVWGFTSESVGVRTGRTCPQYNFYINNPNFQNFEPPLLHEMSHARYLVDLYGMNIYVHDVRLAGSIDNTATTLSIDRNVESDGRFPLPAYLAIEGELVVCQSKVGSTFINCLRGAEGSVARPHSVSAVVNLATVRAQDGRGNLVQGSAALPVIGAWHDHLYFNRYPDDMMNSGIIYRQHSAYAWNRIAGRRPVCGNYNAPCNIGEYLNDLPQHNILELHGVSGQLLSGAQVEVFHGKSFPIWYGRVFLNSPDAVYAADAQGRVDLGHFPFDGGSSIIHTYGRSNAVFLLRISSGGTSVYRFFEVTQANEAYWSGHRDSAIYVLNTDIGDSAWLRTASLPQALSTPFGLAGRQIVVRNGRVYVFGGKNAENERLTNVYYSPANLDGSLGAWTETTPLPGQYYDQVVVHAGNYVYLITGAANATAVYYAPFNPDGTIGAWVSTSPLTPSRQNFAAATFGNYLYASGGNSGGTRNFVKFTSTKADGSLNSWADTTPLPEAMEGHQMVAYNGWLYALAPNSAIYRAPIQANGTLGDWATTTSLPQTISRYTSFEHNGFLWLLGGDSRAVYRASILTDGSIGDWQNKSSLLEPRSGLWAGGNNGFLYAIGGYDGSSYRDTVYYLAPMTPTPTNTFTPTPTPTHTLTPTPTRTSTPTPTPTRTLTPTPTRTFTPTPTPTRTFTPTPTSTPSSDAARAKIIPATKRAYLSASAFTVTLIVEGVTNLGAFQTELTFDPTIVNVTAAAPGAFLSSTGRTVAPVGPTIDNATGKVTFGAFSFGSQGGASGAGTLATITFQPRAVGSTALRLQATGLSDPNGNAISVTTEDGQIQIVNCFGDFNGDNRVDIFDLQRAASHWNCRTGQTCYDAQFDTEPDGDIDVFDLQRFAAAWGTNCTAAVSQAPFGLPRDPAAYPQGTTASSLSLLPANQRVASGAVFTETVRIQEAANVGAFQADLTYNPAVVQVEDVTGGPFLTNTGRTAVPVGPMIDNNAGRVTFGAFSFGSQPGASGAGDLVYVRFRAQANGATTLAFQEAAVSDPLGNPLPLVAQTGAEIVVGTAATYLPLLLNR